MTKPLLRYPKISSKDPVFYKIEYALRKNDETLFDKVLNEDSEAASRIYTLKRVTLLHLIARFGSLEAANRLIQLGADVDAQDKSGRTPLYLSIKWKIEMVQFLLENGANAEINHKSGKTILHAALKYGSIEMVDLLLEKLYNDYESLRSQKGSKNEREGNSIEQKYDHEKCKEIAKFLLKQEIDLNLHNTKYSLLLHFVLKFGDEDTFKLVLHEGKNFDVNTLGPKGYPILYWAVDFDKTNLVEHLVDFGADVNSKGNYKTSILNHAVIKNDPALVRYLLRHNVDLNKKSQIIGYSPLDTAVALRNKEIIQMIAEEGAEINSVLSVACGHQLRKDLLLKSSSSAFDNHENIVDSNNQAEDFLDIEIIKFLIEKGADIEMDKNCVNNLSPLQTACRDARLDIVKILINCGADVFSRHYHGTCMLHHAVVGLNIDVVDFVLSKGLDINARDDYYNPPLYYLLKLQVDEAIPMIEFIVDNGADINIHFGKPLDNLKFFTALHFATCSGSVNLMECLLELLKEDFEYKKARLCPVKYKFSNFLNNDEPHLTKNIEILLAFLATIEENLHDYNTPQSEVSKILDNFFKKCKIEVQAMKDKNISKEKNISFFKFLTSDLVDVAIFGNCEEIMQVLKTEEYKNEFPCYSFLMKKRIARIKDMVRFINAASDLIQDYAKLELPIVVIAKIFSFLYPRDFRNVGRALWIKSTISNLCLDFKPHPTETGDTVIDFNSVFSQFPIRFIKELS